MELSVQLISYLTLIYAVILLVRKGRHSTDIILAVWLIFVAIAYGSGRHRWMTAISFTHCVFLYLYIKYAVLNCRLSIKDLLHFIPFLIAVILCTISPSHLYRKYMPVVSAIWIIYITIYFIMTINIIRSYKKQSDKDYPPGSEYPDIFWLSLNIGITILFHLMNIFVTIAYHLEGWKLKSYADLIVLITLNIIGLKALTMDFAFFKKSTNPENKSKSYSTYRMKEEEAAQLEDKLKNLMETEELYLTPELTLKDLADKLDIPSHHLSYLLNMKFHQNFYEFINTYRLDAVKNELLNPQKKNLSIAAIAYDCGFNSQSTFNRFFKQKEGMSPSKYREQATNTSQ